MTSILEQMARAMWESQLREPVRVAGFDLNAWENQLPHQREVLLKAAKAALQPLLGELPEEVTEHGWSALVVSARASDAEACFHSMIKSILEGGAP